MAGLDPAIHDEIHQTKSFDKSRHFVALDVKSFSPSRCSLTRLANLWLAHALLEADAR
jgi:hypothetical protein